MDTAKVFNTGRSQAVRLPKKYRFKTDEVGIARLDDVVILFPPGKAWDLMERAIRGFTEDFMADRNQPPASDERPGL
jgi:antitoxin VapB